MEEAKKQSRVNRRTGQSESRVNTQTGQRKSGASCTGPHKARRNGRPYMRISMQTDMLSPGYEPSVLLQMDHPNLVKIYEVSRKGNEIILYEEYIKGRTLTEIAEIWREKERRGSRLLRAWRQIRRYRKIKAVFRSVCYALRYLHGMQPQIIHGDVKPDNIMIGRTGKVKLIDFSAVQMTGRQLPPAQRPAMPGGVTRYATACFAAPEVYEGKRADPKQDIYSLGATLLYMLRGEEILAEEDIEKSILLDDESGPLHLLSIAYGCLRRECTLRFQSVDEALRKVTEQA